MAVGYLIGGGSGADPLIITAETKTLLILNLFSYWNADKFVISMRDAEEVDKHSAPELVAIVSELAPQGRWQRLCEPELWLQVRCAAETKPTCSTGNA
jgi:hypothetical protein